MSSRTRPNTSSGGGQWMAPVVLFLLQLIPIGSGQAMTNSVFKLYRDQTVTSSALGWEKFNGEKQQLQFAVRTYGSSEPSRSKELLDTDQLSHASYVCRIQIEGIYCAGQTHMEESSAICTASLQSDIRRHRTFEILVNRGGAGKLKWKHWDSFETAKALGAVSASNGKVDDYYVARCRMEQHGHHHPYVVGNYDPLAKLGGRIYAPMHGVPDATEHKIGEILVEIDPVKYELRNIKLNRIKTTIKKNTTVLGSTILKNEEDGTSQTETVITYAYLRVTYYGRQPGVSNGVPTKVIDPRTQQSVDMYWGVEYKENKFETKAINTILQFGTAINVTLLGNYTETEAPYQANLKAYYDDNSDPASRKIAGYMLSKDMEDVKIEFSPIYWIENGTLVPTTTTTTTTTTTSTTEATTTNEPVPISNTPLAENGFPDNEMSNEIDRSLPSIIEEVASSRSVDKPESSISLSSLGGAGGSAGGSGRSAAPDLRVRWSVELIALLAALATLLMATPRI